MQLEPGVLEALGSCFVTGTDTGVGKTHVTCLLLRTLRGMGRDAVGYKPVCSGDRDDPIALQAAGGGKLSLDEVNPLYLQTPVAPRVAGRLEKIVIDGAALLEGFHHLARRHRVVLVEGAGGWLVPLSENSTMEDLAISMRLPVLVVAANKLGAINHTLLTVRAIEASGLVLRGVVLNHVSLDETPATQSNAGILREVLGDKLLGECSFCGQPAES